MYETIYVHDQGYDEEHERRLALERERMSDCKLVSEKSRHS